VTRFEIVKTGAKATGGQPATQRNVSHRGAEANPSAKALQDKFSSAIKRVEVIWAETIVYVDPASAHEIIRWLHDDQSQRYDFLSDVTAVEYRDAEVPIEVVWQLRSLPYRRFIRVKAQLPKGSPLEIDSVWDIYKSADWLERECYDMFGIHFTGHPDLRRILMPEVFTDFPMRKDFPMQGKMSDQEWAEWIIARAQRTEGDD
jgi:NADH-quinone oxidoreductase subunit C